MYNPFDLVPLIINGEEIFGRPYQFDSEIADHETMQNAFGDLVKPTKVSTVCPGCGSGIDAEVSFAEDPPFSALTINCDNCNPLAGPAEDPFIAPVATGRVDSSELDPLQNVDALDKVTSDGSSVADRLSGLLQGEPEKSEETPEETPAEEKAETPTEVAKPEVTEQKATQPEEPKVPAEEPSVGPEEPQEQAAVVETPKQPKKPTKGKETAKEEAEDAAVETPSFTETTKAPIPGPSALSEPATEPEAPEDEPKTGGNVDKDLSDLLNELE